MKFFECLKCEKVYYNKDIAIDISCCGEKVTEIYENSDSEHEISIKQVGQYFNVRLNDGYHPSNLVHHLKFIIIETNLGYYYRKIEKDAFSSFDYFLLREEKVLNIYIYCNVLGLISKTLMEGEENEV